MWIRGKDLTWTTPSQHHHDGPASVRPSQPIVAWADCDGALMGLASKTSLAIGTMTGAGVCKVARDHKTECVTFHVKADLPMALYAPNTAI
jgi:hypothetical protein